MRIRLAKFVLVAFLFFPIRTAAFARICAPAIPGLLRIPRGKIAKKAAVVSIHAICASANFARCAKYPQ